MISNTKADQIILKLQKDDDLTSILPRFLESADGRGMVTQAIKDVFDSLERNLGLIFDKLAGAGDVQVETLASGCRGDALAKLQFLSGLTVKSSLTKQIVQCDWVDAETKSHVQFTVLPFDTAQARQELAGGSVEGGSYTGLFGNLLAQVEKEGMENLLHLIVCVGSSLQIHVGVCASCNSTERVNVLPMELLSDEERVRESGR